MEKILELLLSIGLGTLYFIVAIAIALLVQLISYRVFKINLYKKVKFILFDKELSYDK